jgi:hypothetical protein
MQLKNLAVATGALSLSALSLSALSLSALACKSEEPAQTSGYPQQTQPAAVGQAPQQPGYGQPVATTPAPMATTPAPVATVPAATTLSPPGPLALPCTSDAQCATARCNTQFGKCVFPCQNDNDCIAPNRCMAGACLPPVPGQ